jgi:hypothetical protein
MPTEPHRLSPAARGVAVYLGDELTAFIRDPLVRDRIADRWAQELDEAGLLADLQPAEAMAGGGLGGARGSRRPWKRTILRMFSRV